MNRLTMVTASVSTSASAEDYSRGRAGGPGGPPPCLSARSLSCSRALGTSMSRARGAHFLGSRRRRSKEEKQQQHGDHSQPRRHEEKFVIVHDAIGVGPPCLERAEPEV